MNLAVTSGSASAFAVWMPRDVAEPKGEPASLCSLRKEPVHFHRDFAVFPRMLETLTAASKLPSVWPCVTNGKIYRNP